MEIPLNAQVECTDGVCGHSAYVLINPVTDQVTSLVVKEDSSPNTEYIVPVDCVTESIVDMIRLRCSKAELEKMEPFIKTMFVQGRVPERFAKGTTFYEPYGTVDFTEYEIEKVQQIPQGELSVRRGTRVEATDGYIGHVDEFVVNPNNSHITHLVMREGHLWGQKDVIIPISAMGGSRKDTVFLKLDKHQIESLPTFPLHRRWS
jgi:sporulation protein YlmC with PRC-barrel domain